MSNTAQSKIDLSCQSDQISRYFKSGLKSAFGKIKENSWDKLTKEQAIIALQVCIKKYHHHSSQIAGCIFLTSSVKDQYHHNILYRQKAMFADMCDLLKRVTTKHGITHSEIKWLY